jgi:hypothetical protein
VGVKYSRGKRFLAGKKGLGSHPEKIKKGGKKVVGVKYSREKGF